MGKAKGRLQLAHPLAAYWDDEVEGLIHNPEHVEVTDFDDDAEFIGLFDADGDPLYRQSERIPLGFHHREPIESLDETEDDDLTEEA